MRVKMVAALTPLLALAGCGGAGGDAVTSISAPPSSSTSTGGTSSGGTSSGGTSGGGSGPVTTVPTGTTTTNPTNMFDVTTQTSFEVISAAHTLNTDHNPGGGELYRGNATPVAESSGTISYNPRDGIFVLKVTDAKAGIDRDVTMQDPLHRTTPDYSHVPYQVPLLNGFNYLDIYVDKAPLTVFYQRPGTTGSFATLAGWEYYKNDPDTLLETSEQGVFVFGTRSTLNETPTSGTARFTGGFLATMMGQTDGAPSVMQWLTGSSAVDVDFSKRSLNVNLTGTVNTVFQGSNPSPISNTGIVAGSTFAASGTASWTTSTNIFAGKFTTASFTDPNGVNTAVDLTPVSAGTSSAGASSIDGSFYGPGAVNVGGNVRITGGIPNQRIDILGGFVGAKQ